MKKELEMKLEKIKKALGDDCEYIALAHIEEKSNENLMNCKEGLDVYYEVKNKYDYLRSAELIFCVDEEKFKDYQVFIIMYKVPKQKEWICIGEAEPYPLVLNTKTGILLKEIEELTEKIKANPGDKKYYSDRAILHNKPDRFDLAMEYHDGLKIQTEYLT